MPVPCPLHPVGPGDAAHREVAAHLATAAARATPAPAGSAAVPVVRLRFPWGDVPVPAAGLTVGRDFGVACGAPIANYDNVSRSHARLYLEQGEVLLVDLDSTNGTTVNGSRLPAHQPTAVVDGDVLGYGNRLCSTVITGADAS